MYENFATLAARAKERPKLPLAIAATTLVPGYVDEEEVEPIARFVSALDAKLPYLLIGYFSCHHLADLPNTSKQQARRCASAARGAGLKKVRLDNQPLLRDALGVREQVVEIARPDGAGEAPVETLQPLARRLVAVAAVVLQLRDPGPGLLEDGRLVLAQQVVDARAVLHVLRFSLGANALPVMGGEPSARPCMREMHSRHVDDNKYSCDKNR